MQTYKIFYSIIFLTVYQAHFLRFYVSDVDFVAVVVASFGRGPMWHILYRPWCLGIYVQVWLLRLPPAPFPCPFHLFLLQACFSVNCVVWTSLLFPPRGSARKAKTLPPTAHNRWHFPPLAVFRLHQCGSSSAASFLAFSFHFLQCATHCIEMSLSLCLCVCVCFGLRCVSLKFLFCGQKKAERGWLNFPSCGQNLLLYFYFLPGVVKILFEVWGFYIVRCFWLHHLPLSIVLIFFLPPNSFYGFLIKCLSLRLAIELVRVLCRLVNSKINCNFKV